MPVAYLVAEIVKFRSLHSPDLNLRADVLHLSTASPLLARTRSPRLRVGRQLLARKRACASHPHSSGECQIRKTDAAIPDLFVYLIGTYQNGLG
jgi:hypothetical protein